MSVVLPALAVVTIHVNSVIRASVVTMISSCTLEIVAPSAPVPGTRVMPEFLKS